MQTRRVFLFAACVLLVPFSANAAPFDNVVGPYAARGFSGAVLVTDHGRVVFDKAYGLADREAGVPNKTSTSFRAAYLSRLFIVTAVVVLAEKDKLSLDNTAEQFVPGAGATAIRELLARSDASSTAVLERVLEAVTGKPLAEALDKVVFEPLWMQGSSIDDDGSRIATVYDVPSQPGTMSTTTRDMLRWTDAFFGDRLVSSSGRGALLAGGGTGWTAADTAPAAWQVGEAESCVLYRPDSETAVIVLGNAGGAVAVAMAREILSRTGSPL